MIKVVKSRYGQDRTLESLEDGNYIIYGKSNYIRFIGNEGEPFDIDYEGGPYIGIGGNLRFIFDLKDDTFIKEIVPIPDMELPHCYKIVVK